MENQKINKVFRSRISVLLLGFILAIIIPGIIPMIKHAIISGVLTKGLCIKAGVLLFMAFLFCGIRYIISGEKLYLKMWFIPNGSVNIADIVSVERSYNLLSSPAASLKRLSINFKTGRMFWLISPVREKEFIDELKAINPNISVKVPKKKGLWRIWDWDI